MTQRPKFHRHCHRKMLQVKQKRPGPLKAASVLRCTVQQISVRCKVGTGAKLLIHTSKRTKRHMSGCNQQIQAYTVFVPVCSLPLSLTTTQWLIVDRMDHSSNIPISRAGKRLFQAFGIKWGGSLNDHHNYQLQPPCMAG